jgi:hypothetical protein
LGLKPLHGIGVRRRGLILFRIKIHEYFYLPYFEWV